MPDRFAKPDFWRLTLVVGFASAFAFCGAKEIWPSLQDGSLRSPGELHSCDLYLEFVTHRPHLAAKLSGALRTLPAEKPIAIVMRDEDPDSSLLGMLSAYLAWPHAVQIVRVQREMPTIRPRDYTAIVYCNLPQERSPLPVIELSSKSGIAIASSQ